MALRESKGFFPLLEGQINPDIGVFGEQELGLFEEVFGGVQYGTFQASKPIAKLKTVSVHCCYEAYNTETQRVLV